MENQGLGRYSDKLSDEIGTENIPQFIQPSNLLYVLADCQMGQINCEHFWM